MNLNTIKQKIGLKNEKISTFLVILAALVLAMLAGSLFLIILKVDPFSAYQQLILGSFTSTYGFGEMLANLTPLLIIGVGVAIGLHAGLNNLGGDGQYYIGAVGMFLVANNFGNKLGYFVIPLEMIAGCIGGAVWGGIAGWLKSKFQANEVITTLMLNYIAVQLVGFLVHNPLKDKNDVMPQTAMIPVTARIPVLITDTRAHTGLFIAFACLVFYWIFMNRTKFGYRIKVLGGSLKAAEYCGIKRGRYYFLIMTISGAFAGLAGAVQIAGVHYRLMENITNGFGFNALVVALIGMLSPWGILIAGVFFSSLQSGAQFLQVGSGVPVTFVNALEGLLVLFVLWGGSYKFKLPFKGENLFKNPAKRSVGTEDEVKKVD